MEHERVVAAQAGDRAAFDLLAQPLRQRLHAHCYRMLGTLDDADDAVQETLLRAWRHLGNFMAERSLLAWTYQIATNVCLTMLQRSKTRGPDTQAPLDPYPDGSYVMASGPADPSSASEQREAVQLAFTAAVLILPPRQRAVLLLRDVLGFAAAEVAPMLAMSIPAVNSALQRARSTLPGPAGDALARAHRPVSSASEEALVRRFVVAWEHANVDELVELLTRDALLAMPPQPDRFVGREAIRAFLRAGRADERPGRFRLLNARANTQPALVTYLRGEPGDCYEAHAVMVLAVQGELIASVTRFQGTGLVERFGHPAMLARDTDDR